MAGVPAGAGDRRARDAPVLAMQTINREHPEYTRRAATWKKYKDLYAGGEQFRENAAEYLVRRHREPLDIYMERLDRKSVV